jgi:L-ascorbate metabolism protein UlaG (beta-lactamase superfamily)
MSLSITWLGHSTFLLGLPGGQRVIVDPWLDNPKCPERFRKPEAVLPLDLILVTHGHFDHMPDTVTLAKASSAPVVCAFELGQYFSQKGVAGVQDMGVGGTQDVAGVTVTMVPAVHSSGLIEEGRFHYMGVAAGYVLRQHGMPTIYIAGDTALFGDMKLIEDLYSPEIAFLPIGDHYTMGPDTAAVAARWLGVRQVVPMHYGTFPLLRGTPAELRKNLAGTDIEVLELQPGETAT